MAEKKKIRSRKPDLVPISRERLEAMCTLRGITVYGLHKKLNDSGLYYSRGAFYACIRNEQINTDILDLIAAYLKCSADYLSGADLLTFAEFFQDPDITREQAEALLQNTEYEIDTAGHIFRRYGFPDYAGMRKTAEKKLREALADLVPLLAVPAGGQLITFSDYVDDLNTIERQRFPEAPEAARQIDMNQYDFSTEVNICMKAIRERIADTHKKAHKRKKTG